MELMDESLTKFLERSSGPLAYHLQVNLIIQIITRNFPEPTKATHIVHDPKYPTGRVLVPVPEVE